MPLGNARDFGIVPEDDPILPVDEQARIAEALGTGENLGQDPILDAETDPVDLSYITDPYAEDAAVVGQYLGDTQEQGLDELMAYLESMKPEYVVTPTDLAVLKNEGIISIDEARTYLEGKGVLGG